MVEAPQLSFGPRGRPDLGALLRSENLCDLTIVCDDGRERVHCHSAVLSQASPFLSTLISACSSCCCQKLIFLPQWQARYLRQLLDLLYLGEAQVSSVVEAGKLSDLGLQLGINVRKWELWKVNATHEVSHVYRKKKPTLTAFFAITLVQK
jgi:hypothetical protein